MFVIRAIFFEQDGSILFIREQEVSAQDTLEKAMRRHGRWAAEAIEKNKNISTFEIKCFRR